MRISSSGVSDLGGSKKNPESVAIVLILVCNSLCLLTLPAQSSRAASSTQPSPTGISPIGYGQGSGAENQAVQDPDWAVGAYSNSTGSSTEGTTWTNLPASPAMGNVSSIQFMTNVGLNAAGDVSYEGTNFAVEGIIVQCVDYYNATSNFPDVNVVFITLYEGSYYYFYYLPAWNVNIGDGSVSQSITYTSEESHTGWWCAMQGDYLGALTETVFTTPIYPPASIEYLAQVGQNIGQIGPFTWSLTSLSTTSVSLDIAGYYVNPSVAFEVNENAAGDFLGNNPSFDAEASVGSGAVYYYAITGSRFFNIGLSSPPATAYASGVTFTLGSGSMRYYDEFGTSVGVNERLTDSWYISRPNVTQVPKTSLPTLNSEGQFYLTVQGKGGTETPQSGYQDAGSSVSISAYGTCGDGAKAGTIFASWTGIGNGSYTGKADSATVKMYSTINETASFTETRLCPQVTSG